MGADSLKALFEPFGPVTVRRMFGGSGIYADGLCFAIEADGDVYIKADASLAAELFGGRVRSVHLCDERQAEVHVVLAAA